MRCDQYVGLNQWASEKVSRQQSVREVGARILPNGKAVPFDRKIAVPVAKVEVIGKISGSLDGPRGQSAPVLATGRTGLRGVHSGRAVVERALLLHCPEKQ